MDLDKQNKSKHYFDSARHLVKYTYPLTQEPRVLLVACQNLFLAVLHSKSAMFNDSSLDDLSSDRLLGKGISHNSILFLEEIRVIVSAHKTSPVEFSKEGKYVICSDNYDLNILSLAKIDELLVKAKVFIDETNLIIEDNERISHQCPRRT